MDESRYSSLSLLLLYLYLRVQVRSQAYSKYSSRNVSGFGGERYCESEVMRTKTGRRDSR